MSLSSKNWINPPGGFDALNIRRRHFPASNPWGFPDIEAQTWEFNPSRPWLPYSARDDLGTRHQGAICHFFLDDFRFESVWNRPAAGLRRVSRFWATTTPDFSMFTDWPLIVQQWNHYRRQWLGRYWQENGIRVIPTVNWSTPDTFRWCFAGIKPRQIVALAVPDCRQRLVRSRFERGFEAMVERLKPKIIAVCGTLFSNLQATGYEVVEFKSPRMEMRERLTAPKNHQPSARGQPEAND